jgi:hypothetical protein
MKACIQQLLGEVSSGRPPSVYFHVGSNLLVQVGKSNSRPWASGQRTGPAGARSYWNGRPRLAGLARSSRGPRRRRVGGPPGLAILRDDNLNDAREEKAVGAKAQAAPCLVILRSAEI